MIEETEKELRNELKSLKKEVELIKSNMIDRDMVITLDESKRLRESISEYKRDKGT